MKTITKTEAKNRAREFWKKCLMTDEPEALCYEDNGFQWQIYLGEGNYDIFWLSCEGYSEEHKGWRTLNEVADIIYEFVNR